MPTPETNLRIFVRPSMEEIVFPDNSATFVDYQLEQIDEGVQLVRDVNGNLRDLSNPAFRKYRLTLSATDNWLPALGNLWAGQVVDVELPEAIAERGATPSRTAVSGTIVVSGGYVRYRPRLTMMIAKAPSLSGVEFRGKAAGWTIELEEANGATDVPESSERLILAPRPMESATQGTALSVNYAAELTKIPEAQAVTWSVSVGSLPPGLTLNAATGVVSGTPSSGGAYAFTLRATGAVDVFAEQTYVFDVEPLSFTATGGTYVTWTDPAGRSWAGIEFTSTDNQVVPRGGDMNFALCGSGGGGGRSTSTPGAGGGGGGLPVFGRVYVPAGTYPVVIPAGGAEQTAGSPCTWNGFSSEGGGRGGNPTQNGGAGGNGGGGGGRAASTGDTSGGVASPGGFGGGNGLAYTNTSLQIGGGGGGASGGGGNGRGTILGAPGGPGLALRLHRLITLGGGGGGGASSTSGPGADGAAPHGGDGGGSGENGRNAAANSGGGGGGAGGGASGTRTGGQGGSGWAFFWWEI